MTQLNSSGKGGGPCHSYRVKRIPRGMNGELLGGNIMKDPHTHHIPEASTEGGNQDGTGSVDRTGLIYGSSICYRSPQEETQALFSDLDTDLLIIEAMTKAACRASKLRNIQQTSILNTLPTILCSLIANLLAIRAYERSSNYLGQNGVPPELNETHLLSRPQPKALTFVLERALYNIIINYYNYLNRFEFPKEYQEIIQEFASFHHP